jgi:polysaccharide pyruvyl transferase WcaK-like protein
MSDDYFVLAGGYDTKNVGDYAMLDLICRASKSNGTAIRLLARHQHSHLVDIYGVSELIENYEYPNKSLSKGRMFHGFNYGDSMEHLFRLKELLEGSRGLIIGGGRLLIDHTLDVMRGPLPYFATLVMLCRFLGIPVYVYAMTIVPNSTSEGDKWVRFIIDNAKRVAVRDEQSVEIIRSIGCLQKDVRILPDPAYALWPEAIDREPRKYLAGLTVRKIDEGWGGIKQDKYIDLMAMVVSKVRESGMDIVGVPHQYYGIDDPDYDDRTILRKINKKIPFDLIEDEMLDLEEYAELYGSLSLLVGIRRHSFVFAAVAGVPVLPFAENPNAARVCREIGTVDPLPVDFDIKDFEKKLNEILENRSRYLARQKHNVQNLAHGLADSYKDWLFC